MAELLFGAETEYAVAWRGIKKGQPPEQAAIELLRLAGERLTHLPAMNSSGIFLANGARFYVDCGTHPEYCTPECTDPWELVRQVEAGHRILRQISRARRGPPANGKTPSCASGPTSTTVAPALRGAATSPISCATAWTPWPCS